MKRRAAASAGAEPLLSASPACAPRANALWVGMRLRALLLHAQSGSAYYRRHWGEWQVDHDAWTDLPPVTKHRLMRSFDEWLTDPDVTLNRVQAFLADPGRIGDDFLGHYAVWTSSGTTGDAGVFVQDAQALAVYATLTTFSHDGADLLSRWMQGDWWRGARSALVAAITGHYAGVSYWRRVCRVQPWLGAQSKLFSVMEPIARLCEGLNDFQPALLASYPSMLLELARQQQAGVLRLNPSSLWAGGERLAPGVRAEIEAAFGCRVTNDYGASECLNIAFECARGRLHLNDDWVMLEPVDRHGRPVPAGESSHSVLLTNLANHVQPIVRYELGDSVMFYPDACSCGNPRPSLRVHGRSDDVLCLHDRRGRAVRLSPMALTTAVEEHSPVRRFQLCQTGDGAIAVRLDLRACATPQTAERDALQALRQYLVHQGLGHVHVRRDDALPQPEAGSGKLRQVIALPPGAAHRHAPQARIRA